MNRVQDGSGARFALPCGALLLAALSLLAAPACAQAGPPGQVQEFDLRFAHPHLIHVSWLPPAQTEGLPVLAYRVHARTPDAAGGGEIQVVAELPGEARNATLSRYPVGTTVFWSVSALTEAGEGPRTHEITTRIPPVYGPPQRLRATLGEQRVLLAWDPPANKTTYSHDPSYLVYRRTEPEGAFALLGATYRLSIEDVAPPDGAALAYVVVANTTAGASPPSEPARIDTPWLPGAPANLWAIADVGRVRLSWEAPPPLPDGGRLERYRIYRAEPGDEAPTLLREVVGVDTFTDRNLPEEATFLYAVLAVTSWGEGAFSEIVQVTTLPQTAAPAPDPAQPPQEPTAAAGAPEAASPSFWLTAPLNWTLGTVVTTLVGGSVLALRKRRAALRSMVEERAPLVRAAPQSPDALRAYLSLVRTQGLAVPPGLRTARRRLDDALDARTGAEGAQAEVEEACRGFLAELERHARRWRIPWPAIPARPDPEPEAPGAAAEG